MSKPLSAPTVCLSVPTATVGFPRIGRNRELKKALEAYWQGQLEIDRLQQTAEMIAQENWNTQRAAGIDYIGVGDMSLYDPMLDWSLRLGIVPERFAALSGWERYFAMARGYEGIPALEMTKWFDTNYHYLVPEVGDRWQEPDFSDFVATVQQAQQLLGDSARPIVIGPVTFLRLSRLSIPLEQAAAQLGDRYQALLETLQSLGVKGVQFHEPALVLSDAVNFQSLYERLYQQLSAVGLPLHLVTYFDDLGAAYPWAVRLPVASLSLDFTRGTNLALLQQHGFPPDKTLGVGIVDARNVWALQPQSVLTTLEAILQVTSQIQLQPSASLQFVPYDVRRETKLAAPLRRVLSFAEQKLEEVRLLADYLKGQAGAVDALQQRANQWTAFSAFSPANSTVQSQLKALTAKDFERSLPYEERRKQQIQLPLLPTTTIGSFPQTAEVRQLRVKLKRGEISQAAYEAAIDAEIAKCIRLQEEANLDVLVHGEFERTDMVEFFAQQLSGFALTEHGWVQSYGSRCVRPPIIYGDIFRPQPMTLREFKVAQSLTGKPVKGMLTGPVTMLNWSFPRCDLPRQEQAFQIALALRQEVADLEAAGAKIIQIDEPALREGLPLKTERWSDYLSWAVDAFRLAAGGAQPQTQIHTHMCYSEFGDIIEHIERLDADVLSIENSRSNNETLFEITDAGYRHQVGNGVYDVHSPAVPTVEQVVRQLKTALEHLPAAQIWVNPDCGLKTRRWEEVIPALKNMVAASLQLRTELQNSVSRE
ncbi:5-methyltetrahydropteroyltriglutamate--homocysteine S-methyltransferase [uncultured Thermosynechococcus sp.]|uniref:5-methyltetrahydropteroyltriglutamate-- homocysteine S-methyltransferase n=1 Tax=uncultured Thermosynechococcus sp. TaxID=436945 RepID=UPI0026334885|nr:5-methyltetrahydropteroyltriglutamate--homocysteine S-methyltransferase [uncultured Thermosynechococcus sp.]